MLRGGCCIYSLLLRETSWWTAMPTTQLKAQDSMAPTRHRWRPSRIFTDMRLWNNHQDALVTVCGFDRRLFTRCGSRRKIHEKSVPAPDRSQLNKTQAHQFDFLGAPPDFYLYFVKGFFFCLPIWTHLEHDAESWTQTHAPTQRHAIHNVSNEMRDAAPWWSSAARWHFKDRETAGGGGGRRQLWQLATWRAASVWPNKHRLKENSMQLLLFLFFFIFRKYYLLWHDYFLFLFLGWLRLAFAAPPQGKCGFWLSLLAYDWSGLFFFSKNMTHRNRQETRCNPAQDLCKKKKKRTTWKNSLQVTSTLCIIRK